MSECQTITKAQLDLAIEAGIMTKDDAFAKVCAGTLALVAVGGIRTPTKTRAATPAATDGQALTPKVTYKKVNRRGGHKKGAAGKKYPDCWMDMADGKCKYIGTLAPVVPNDPRGTHDARIDATENIIPNLFADDGILDFFSLGRDKDNKDETVYSQMVNIPFMYIQLGSPKKYPTIAGKAHSEVTKILYHNGYGYSSSNQMWVSDSKGFPCRKGGEARGAGKTAQANRKKV